MRDAGPGGLDAAAFASSRTVRRWLDASALAEAAAQEQLATLARFLTEAGHGPDELVASLFRPTDAGPRIRLARRREVMEQIARWEVENGRQAGNVVRAFLVQNGVALTASPIW